MRPLVMFFCQKCKTGYLKFSTANDCCKPKMRWVCRAEGCYQDYDTAEEASKCCTEVINQTEQERKHANVCASA